jgi:hypothetical protein
MSGISITKHRWAMATLAGLSLATAMLVPVERAAAATFPAHSADVVYCFGGGNSFPNRDIIEVAAPVVYAYNRRAGVLDSQYVTWRADLLKWNGSSWVTTLYGPWATPYLTYDGEGVAPEFDLAGRILRGMRFNNVPTHALYSVRITVHWYAVGSLGATQSSIIPSHFLPMGGGLPTGGQWCDYYPDQGLVDLPY